MAHRRAEWLLVLACASAGATPYRAPVQVTQPAPFLALEVGSDAWRYGRRADLQDWQLLDASGRRVPFALQPDEGPVAPADRAVPLFALPPPVAAASASHAPTPAVRAPAGWLVDLGEPPGWPGAPARLRLHWPADAAPFQAGYRLETSADLQTWRPLGTGQLLGVHTADGAPLTQPSLDLPGSPQRYLRLLWDDAARAVKPDAATLAWQPSGLPPSHTARTAPLPAPDADGGWVIPLGGPQPLMSLALSGSQGTWVLPVQVQTRADPHAPWQTVARAVFYRVDRGTAPADAAPAVPLTLAVSEVRLLPPRGTAMPPNGTLQLSWTTRTPRLVWAVQGQPPFSLEVGVTSPEAGPRPLPDVVPDWPAEQARLGRARVGEFVAQPAAAAPAPPALPPRRLLLWAVLGLGVAALAALTWRLWRQGPAVDTST
ncbi:DUF3999 family protein [Roseateles sp. BYS96W]|uniref:DUF3999 family protein n=1 Tax=Pelomonas nitida TaxID=3299027 RepID=A0ABW7G260_9BURK